MSEIARVFTGADIHDGTHLHHGKVLAQMQDGSRRILAFEQVPQGVPTERLQVGVLCPGFVDLQVNGGGGVMFNDSPDVATLRRMAKAHRSTGVAALLPTLITDTPDKTEAAIEAVVAAIAEGVPGIIGLHLEGPHLALSRKGAHDGALIRPMEAADLALILRAAVLLPNLMVTVAPENTSNAQIAAMAEAGVIVSLGHSDADYETSMAAFDAGATCVTHLFNAMSQMGNRAPGLVGAALARDGVHAGLIADGIHVHPASMRNALAAKGEGIFLVSDAMATAGSDIAGFTLNGREVYRAEGRLTLADGTLAGADLALGRAVRSLIHAVGEPLEAALARAISGPLALLRDDMGLGRIESAGQPLLLFDPESGAVDLLA
ncbi:N-acetylglucosamine-6-phosphate deacetylase [Sulfitobacter sp. HI0082]|uniref:N-acetylglucosamine-6-phosphate deacetylase n=1 Tax=uncultured Sulfitobacter sp. TaxID=191468 RepID=UPI0007CF7989|nr:N-acetylglucosamine-6-phosphate deacetylase [Sulfitobacter sp. HI0082]HAC51021.1 N-acetylglucosamine-6-phosphate deacetylase [Sulfitobacter sp.]|tara:strand:- start:4876 stop:6006 length:1131 start_codon:yes stop_codon:yes gene_type:complete